MSIQSGLSGVLQQGLQSAVAYKVSKNKKLEQVKKATKKASREKPQFDTQRANEVLNRLEAQLNARTEQNLRIQKVKENIKSRGSKRQLSPENLRKMYEFIKTNKE